MAGGLDGVYQFSLCIAGVRADAVEGHFYAVGAEVFAFQVAALAAVQGVADGGTEAFHVNGIYAAGLLLRRG